MQSALSNPTSIARRVILTLVALACLYVWCGAIALAGVVPSFQGLGDFVGGDVDSRATNLSADGSIAVGFGQRGTTCSGLTSCRATMDSSAGASLSCLELSPGEVPSLRAPTGKLPAGYRITLAAMALTSDSCNCGTHLSAFSSNKADSIAAWPIPR